MLNELMRVYVVSALIVWPILMFYFLPGYKEENIRYAKPAYEPISMILLTVVSFVLSSVWLFLLVALFCVWLVKGMQRKG